MNDENPYRAPTETTEPPPVRGWSTMERCGLLYLASAVGGAIGKAIHGHGHIGGPLMEAMPGVYGVLIGLAIGVVFLLVDDARKER